MAVPKRRTTRSRKRMRNSHLAIRAVGFVESKTNGSIHMPHRIDPEGFYNGRRIFVSISKTKLKDGA